MTVETRELKFSTKGEVQLIDITGKVAAVGGRMLDGASRAVVKLFFERLANQISVPAAATVTAAATPSLWQRIMRWLGMR